MSNRLQLLLGTALAVLSALVVEVTVGDGKTVTRQTIRATDLPPNSSKRFTIPVDATGKGWIRFAAYDSAGNPAFAQPRWFNPANR